MLIRLGILFVLVTTTATAAPVEFLGAIGPYQIELELERADERLIGRYRYAGRDSWITLEGVAFGNAALRLEENVGDKITGQFFLEAVNDSFEGYWANETSDFAVAITPAEGAIEKLFINPQINDVTATPTGKYSIGYYWVNDWFAPHYEIGFNGGEANVVLVNPNQILVGFELVVGPTYHFASFLGHASLTEDGSYLHKSVLPGGDEPCRLVFRFEGTQLSIEDVNNGFACQFGARAHANFDLPKISDTAEFDIRW